MVFRFALLAVVVARRQLALLRKAHTRAVLPYHAHFALDHELWSIAIIVNCVDGKSGVELRLWSEPQLSTYIGPRKHNA